MKLTENRKTLDKLQKDLDIWIREYNEQRPHSRKYCFGKTPMRRLWIRYRWQKRKC